MTLRRTPSPVRARTPWPRGRALSRPRRSLVLGEQDAAKRSRLVSMAKVEVAAAGRFVGESAVQLHGGMGMTDELDVGDYFKRLTFADMLLGDTNYHLQRMQDIGH